MKKVLLIFTSVLLLDRVTKYLVISLLPYGDEVRLVGDFVKITHVRNPNSLWSLSLGKNFPYILVGIFALLFLVFLIVDALKSSKEFYACVYTLLLAGVAGNLLDRIFFKEVIDFIDIGVSPKTRWPVFNVADSSISIGLALYFIILLREIFTKRSVQ